MEYNNRGVMFFFFIFLYGYLIDAGLFIEKSKQTKSTPSFPHCLVVPTYNFVVNQVHISA